MKRTVRVFAIPKARVPGGPPNPACEVVIEASSLEAVAIIRTLFELPIKNLLFSYHHHLTV